MWFSALNPGYIHESPGVTIIAIIFIMLYAKNTKNLELIKGKRLTELLQINGIYTEETSGEEIGWTVHRTKSGMFGFMIVGFLECIFGVGAVERLFPLWTSWCELRKKFKLLAAVSHFQ